MWPDPQHTETADHPLWEEWCAELEGGEEE